MVIGDDRIAWNGTIYGFTAFKSGYKREILKNLSTLVLEGKDVRDVVYLKKHWYHLWGHMFIWAHPQNIRVLEGEASQDSVDYDLEIKKIWSWNVKKAISQLEDKGFVLEEDAHKFYKDWCKHYLLEKYK